LREAAFVCAALAAAILAPVAVKVEPAARHPLAAAALAEDTLPRLGLVWGKVRGWDRVGEGWRVVWQPAHGAWLLWAWIPDGAAPTGWWLDVAPWLPGARLSPQAAAAVAGANGEQVPRERLGRRDWHVGEHRVVGALPAGRRVPGPPRETDLAWGSLLAGLLFAGALGRVLLPVVVSTTWRRVVGWSVLVAIAALPLLAPLAGRRFAVGVRPLVTQLVFAATVAVVLVAVAIAAVRYPAGTGRPPGAVLALCLAAGLLAGRTEPVAWCAEAAGLTARPVVWLLAVIAGGFLAGLAGDGLRQLIAPAGRAAPALLTVAGATAVPFAGPWLGVSVAVVGAAAGGRGQGTPAGAAAMLGWLVGATWATCAWSGALRDTLLLLLAGVAAITFATLSEARHRV
jgi:hypothetical protein